MYNSNEQTVRNGQKHHKLKRIHEETAVKLHTVITICKQYTVHRTTLV